MILVITGTEVHPFNRLAEEVDRLVETGRIDDNVFVQVGHTPYQPRHCTVRKFIDFGEMCQRMQEASVIVTHAGAGATLLCLQYNRRPVIVPRYQRFGEHIDDHQVPFATKLDEFGLVRLVREIADLGAAIDAAEKERTVADRTSEAAGIIRYLDEYCCSAFGAGGSS